MHTIATSPNLPHYTPRLIARLDALKEAFSHVRRPLFAPIYASEDETEISQKAVMLLHKLDDGNMTVNPSTVAEIKPLLFFCSPDVILWLIPQILTALRDKWALRLSEETEFKEKSYAGNSGDMVNFCLWKCDMLSEARFVMNDIARIFCDVYENERSEDFDSCQYLLRSRLENAKVYETLMTSDMKSSMKSYLIEWYRVMGERFVVLLSDVVVFSISRLHAHNFWM